MSACRSASTGCSTASPCGATPSPRSPSASLSSAPAKSTSASTRTSRSAWQRTAEGHEVGHIIAYHPHRLYTCQPGEWFRDPYEHEAQLGAALLLVPLNAVRTYGVEFTAEELATLLNVPVGLIDLRWSFAQVNGEL